MPELSAHHKIIFLAYYSGVDAQNLRNIVELIVANEMTGLKKKYLQKLYFRLLPRLAARKSTTIKCRKFCAYLRPPGMERE